MIVGLSVGAYCLSYCFPFLATFITSEDRRVKTNGVLIIYFMTGRLIGYMLFGFLFSYLGQTLQYRYLDFITDISLILTSIVLIMHITGLYKRKSDACPIQKFPQKNAFIMGFLMGVNICPPFLLSLTYVFSLHSITQGLFYFLIFFLASSIYFLPLIFVGMLGRFRELQKIARASGIAAGGIFIVYGVYSIISHFKIGGS